MAPIVDAHHDLLDPARIHYPFLRFLPELATPTLPEDLKPHLEHAGVAFSVPVQAADHEDETRFLLAEARRTDWMPGVVGWLPLASPDATARGLEAEGADRLLCGVRHLIHDEPDPDWVVQEAVLASLALLASSARSFDLSAFEPRHLDHVRRIAERVPELDVVVCHLGVPRLHEGEWEPWASSFAGAAENPRCVVKISGLDMTIGGCDADRFRPYLDHALEHFGPERMIWASNWPVSLRGKGYAELLQTSQGLLAGLSESERSAVFGGTANRVYRLGLPGF